VTEIELTVERAKETLLALRKAARPLPDGRKGFAHDKAYRAAFVKGILERRRFIRGWK